MPGDEDFRPDRKPAMLVVGQPPHGKPVVACHQIAVAVNIEHVAGLTIYGSLIGPG